MQRAKGEGTSPSISFCAVQTRLSACSRRSGEIIRHLFLPACPCLATLPNPTGSDCGISLNHFFAANALTRVADARASVNDQENEAAVSEIAEAAADTPDSRVTEPSPATEPSIPLPVVRRTPKPVITRSHQEICGTLVDAAQSNDLPVPFFIHRAIYAGDGGQCWSQ
jgi:hypothetical protein